MISSNKYYVYIYSDPRSSIPFYVGKGCENRMYYHLQLSSRDKNYTKKSRIARLVELDMLPHISVPFRNLPEEDALEIEELLIKTIGRIDLCSGSLTNLTDGEFLLNKSPERRNSSGRNMKGSNNPRFGKPVSSETRLKISESNKEFYRNIEHHPSKGKLHSNETKLHLSQIRRNKYWNKSESEVYDTFKKYKVFVDLYISRPELKNKCEYIQRNGIFLTYKRQFCKEYHEKFNISANGMYNILSGKSIVVYNKLFLDIGVDLCSI